MILHELLVRSVHESASQVFSTMLGMELGEPEVFTESAAPEPNDGLVSFIGVAGKWVGTGSLYCSATLACKLCSQMLMTEATAVDEEVLDAIAELTNMIIGNVKTELESHLGPLGLSIPTVIFGRNFKAKSAGNKEWTVLRFPCEGEALLVKICLAPSERIPHLAPHILGQTCPLDVLTKQE